MAIIVRKEIMCWLRTVEEKDADDILLCHKCANHEEDHPMVAGDIFLGYIDDIYICDHCSSRIDTQSFLRKCGAPEKII